MYRYNWCCFLWLNMSRVRNMIYIWVCPEFIFVGHVLLDFGRFNCQKCIFLMQAIRDAWISFYVLLKFCSWLLTRFAYIQKLSQSWILCTCTLWCCQATAMVLVISASPQWLYKLDFSPSSMPYDSEIYPLLNIKNEGNCWQGTTCFYPQTYWFSTNNTANTSTAFNIMGKCSQWCRGEWLLWLFYQIF